MSLPNSQPGPFARIAEKIVFANRPVILVLFALITVAMAYFASQLEVDAGFKKQVPLQHEYMQTFQDYEAEFGGANRVLVAVIAKDGDMLDQQFMSTLENVTSDVINLSATDDARARSLFTPNVRFIEVVEDGLSGGNVIPQTFTPNVEGFQALPEDFEQIRSNIIKANIVGRLVAKDFSGAMIWADLIPESPVERSDGPEPALEGDLQNGLALIRVGEQAFRALDPVVVDQPVEVREAQHCADALGDLVLRLAQARGDIADPEVGSGVDGFVAQQVGGTGGVPRLLGKHLLQQDQGLPAEKHTPQIEHHPLHRRRVPHHGQFSLAAIEALAVSNASGALFMLVSPCSGGVCKAAMMPTCSTRRARGNP